MDNSKSAAELKAEYETRKAVLDQVLLSLDRLGPALPNLLGYYVQQTQWSSGLSEAKRRWKEGLDRLKECDASLENAKEVLGITYKSAERDGSGIIVKEVGQRSRPIETLVFPQYVIPVPQNKAALPPSQPYSLPAHLDVPLKTPIDIRLFIKDHFASTIEMYDPNESTSSTKTKEQKFKESWGDLERTLGRDGEHNVLWIRIPGVMKIYILICPPKPNEESFFVKKITSYSLLENLQPYETSTHSLFQLLDSSLTSTLYTISPMYPPSLPTVLYLLSTYSTLFTTPCRFCNSLVVPLHDRNLHTSIGGVQPPTRRIWIGLQKVTGTDSERVMEGAMDVDPPLIETGDTQKKDESWWAFHEGCWDQVNR